MDKRVLFNIFRSGGRWLVKAGELCSVSLDFAVKVYDTKSSSYFFLRRVFIIRFKNKAASAASLAENSAEAADVQEDTLRRINGDDFEVTELSEGVIYNRNPKK